MKVISLDRLTPTVRQLNAKCHGGPRVIAPGGVMVHFDDSASDRSGEGWFKDPDCKFGYNRYYLDNGDVVQLTPSMAEAAYHAGPCATRNANSHYYGLAIAAKDGDTVTPKQLDTLVADILRILAFHDEWGAEPADRVARVVGHEEQAVFTKKDYPTKPEKWGKLGRKCDPTGTRADRPVLAPSALRDVLRQHLGAAA